MNGSEPLDKIFVIEKEGIAQNNNILERKKVPQNEIKNEIKVENDKEEQKMQSKKNRA